MAGPSVDHRRATAERNAAGILDATERLLAKGASLNMRAVAAEAGVSRPTLYAHYKTLGEVVEAAVARVVGASLAAIEAAEPAAGPANEALERMVAASWAQLARFDALARGAREHLPPGGVSRTHAPLVKPLHDLVERGRSDGTFRSDVPADWLVTMYFAIVHGADDHVHAHRVARRRALELLTTTLLDVFRAPAAHG